MNINPIPIALIEQLETENLNPIEEAKAYKSLNSSFSYSHKDIAKMLGKDRTTIANAIRLLHLPLRIQSMIEKGELSSGHARALLGLRDPNLIWSVSKKINKYGLSVRRTENLVRALNQGEKDINNKSLDADQRLIVELERNVGERLGCKVFIKKMGEGFLVEAHYSGLREMDNLFSLLGIEL